MKRIFFISIYLIFAVLIFTNCNQEDYSNSDSLSENEANLNLQSPSGEFIARNVLELKQGLAPVIEYSNGESKDFEILNIQFDNINSGFLAEIEYRTEDGIQSNIIIKSIANQNIQRIKTRSEDYFDGYVTYSCKKSSNNKCRKCRTVNDKKHNQIRCACDDGLVEGCDLYEYKY